MADPTGVPSKAATVAVIGLGKVGLPLAARFAESGWQVIGVDVDPAVIAALDGASPHPGTEPGVAERIGTARAEGRFEATPDHAMAVARSDVVVIIVPLGVTAEGRPDYRAIDSATGSIAPGLRPGSLVIYETTLPVGDTRGHFGPALAQASGLSMGDPAHGFLLAYSPERVYAGRVLQDLATYPKLVGGIDRTSTERATAFYRDVLTADVRPLRSAEAAELAKLAETSYRNVNIALANELARAAEDASVDILEVIEAANTQPYSHIHRPGLGVGGHCIPVYPRLLLHSTPHLALVETAMRVNGEQVDRGIDLLDGALGGLSGKAALVLGLTYREGVRELAYSQGPQLIRALTERGARVSAFDPLLDGADVQDLGAESYVWGTTADAHAIVTQTADPLWRTLDPARYPDLRAVLDGRNSLRGLALPPDVAYLGMGLRRTEPTDAGRA